MSFNQGNVLKPNQNNGTYSTTLFTERGVDIISAHPIDRPLYLQLSYQAVHYATGHFRMAHQAPCSTVHAHYANAPNDATKVQGAVLTELDTGVGAVVKALVDRNMWNNTLLVFQSDNGGWQMAGGPSSNAPFRGGKLSWWEGGNRVVAFAAGGAIPAARRGTKFTGLMHITDWYKTLTLGVARIPHIPDDPHSPRSLDGHNVWDALLTGTPSPRQTVILQVNNSYWSHEGVSVIRHGPYKLIRGPPGDDRITTWPANSNQRVPFGQQYASLR